jgi:hypothetical protein
MQNVQKYSQIGAFEYLLVDEKRKLGKVKMNPKKNS